MISVKYLIRLAFRNVLRQKRRTLLTMVVIITSVGSFLFMFSYLKGAFGSMIEDSIKQTGHINIRHPDYNLKERMLSLNVPVEDCRDIKESLKTIPGISSAGGRIKFGGLIYFNEKDEQGLGMAIEPEIEENNLKISDSIVTGRSFSENNLARKYGETIVGSELAANLGLTPGDTITVLSRTPYSSMAAGKFVVTGIVNLLNPMMNRIFYIRLDKGQEMLDMADQASEITLFLDDIEKTAEITDQILNTNGIKENYIALPWFENSFIKQYLPIIDVAYVIIIGLFGTLAAFGIINTMLMAVMERTGEIGVMTAFGMKRKDILKVFITEALIIGFLGGIAGIVIGGYWAHYLEVNGISLGNVAKDLSLPIRQVVYADMRWWHVIFSFLLGMVVSLISAIFPALKAARLEPTKALRSF
ncbi:ABC transporter permease [candidate division KSB1 bacterium]